MFAALCVALASCGFAAAEAMPEGFEPFVWAEFQKLDPADLAAILAFDTVIDGSEELPILPVARLGADGVEGTVDDLSLPEWVRLRGLLGSAQAGAALAQGNAALAQGEAALRSAEGAEAIVEALQEAVNN